MAPRSPRYSVSGPPATRSRSVGFVRLHCERLEAREVPTLFNVSAVGTSGAGLSNNGCVAAADLNKDGYMDAVLTNYGGTNEPPFNFPTGTTITVLYGQPAGTDPIPATLGTGGENVSFVTIADINGDGWQDVVATNANRQNVGSVAVFRNDQGDLVRVGNAFPSGGNNTSWVGLSDITGDNVLDLVVGSFGKAGTDSEGEPNFIGNKVAIFQGSADAQGRGNFTFSANPIASLSPTGDNVFRFVPTALAVADFDGDGFVDIAAVSTGVPENQGDPIPNGGVWIFRGTGAGGFSETVDKYSSGGKLPVNVQVADVNADNRPDLIIANTGDPQVDPTTKLPTYTWVGGTVAVVRNISAPGSISFSAVPTTMPGSTRGPFAVAVTDFNLDGKADIAAINYGAPIPFAGAEASFVSVYQGNGAGAFTSAVPDRYTVSFTAGGQYLAVADFNNDQVPDLITSSDINRVSVLTNTTTGNPKVQAVAVNGGQTNAAQRSRVTNLQVTFDTLVTITPNTSTAWAFTLRRVGTYDGFAGDNALVTPTFTTATVNGKTVATLSFPAGANVQTGSLADGVWQLTVDRSRVRTASNVYMGFNYTTPGAGDGRLFRLFGDVTGDGEVSAQDALLFDRSFGSFTGESRYIAAFDWNNDGEISAQDSLIFDRNFGRIL